MGLNSSEGKDVPFELEKSLGICLESLSREIGFASHRVFELGNCSPPAITEESKRVIDSMQLLSPSIGMKERTNL